LGFDNDNEDERTLPRERLYEKIRQLREILYEDRKKDLGHFDGVDVVLNIPLNKPLEIKDIECKGWYQSSGSGSVLMKACSNCVYRIK